MHSPKPVSSIFQNVIKEKTKQTSKKEEEEEEESRTMLFTHAPGGTTPIPSSTS